MFWAACCVAFFWLPQSKQIHSANPIREHDNLTHLSLKYISLDTHSSPCLIKLYIKQSKTDPFRQGVDIYLRATDTPICLVSALIPYLAKRGAQQGPVTKDKVYLTRVLFSKKLGNILDLLHINSQQYSTHSFRIGAATTAAQALIPDALIKMLGRWRIEAYQRYIKTPPQELAQLTRHLTSTCSLQQTD